MRIKESTQGIIFGALMGVIGGLGANYLYGFSFPDQIGTFTDLWAPFYFGLLGIFLGKKLGDQREAISNKEEKVVKAEASLKESPDNEQAAWAVARAQIELYVSQNQAQLRSIYILTIFVMTIGFIMISIGVILSYQEKLQPGLISSVSGIIVSFIGGTFLLLYKSAIVQSKDYMQVLDRINAVGMSLQVLEKIEENKELADKTRADLSISLMGLYGKNKAP